MRGQLARPVLRGPRRSNAPGLPDGARREDGRHVHLLSALDAGTGVVLAQVAVDAKSNEIPAFAPLLDAVETVLGTLAGVLFIAAALHTQTRHADEVTARQAHLMVQVKANQPTLFNQLKRLPWAQIPVGDRTRDRGHGRRETRTVKSRHRSHARRHRVPIRAAGRPDHPHPYRRWQDQPRNRLPDRVTTHRSSPAPRPADLDPQALAHREHDPPRP
ncbi:ISAs1 family transposase [Dactylosporangium sp. NPDC000521]|uniref:ISAs1 family transposase n=1 Tax=Dactylosporangium sp. NPDC000521 TaxID=3363975 RepID=UPI0036D106F2